MRNFLIGTVAGLAAGALVFLVVGRVGTHHAQEQHPDRPVMTATSGLTPLSAERTAKVLAVAPPGTGATKPAPAAPAASATTNAAPAVSATTSAASAAAKPAPASAAGATTSAAPAAPKPAAAPVAAAATNAAPAANATTAPAATAASATAAPAATAVSASTASGADLVAQGEKVFAPCKACHTTDAGGADRLGPNLHGLFGRKSGTKAGYKYSEAMTKAGVTWDEATFDTYMANPKTFIPGNRMAFPGVPKPENRAALIAFLKQATK